jgi:transaldolase
VPEDLRNRLGIAIGQQTCAECRRFYTSDRRRRFLSEGARPQRLLFASTGTKDPAASDVLYVEGLAAPYTVNTMPEEALLAFADHGAVGSLLAADPAPAQALLARFAAAGVDLEAVGHDLQVKGAES